MSVFDEEVPAIIDVVMDGKRLERDEKLIKQYTETARGFGLESLDDNATHQLVMQGLKDRYGRYGAIGTGNEGLITLGLLVGAGYLAYKKIMKNKKDNKLLEKAIDIDKKVEATYTNNWINNKESRGGLVACGELTSYFKGDQFSNFNNAIVPAVDVMMGALKEARAELYAAWEDIGEIARRWLAATTPEERSAIHKELKDRYPASPFVRLGEHANKSFILKVGRPSKIKALEVSEYDDAVRILEEVTDRLVTLEKDDRDMWNTVGLWSNDYGDIDIGDVEKYPGGEDIYTYAHIDNVIDGISGPLYDARCIILAISRGVEELIISSFK